jgi:hypothetical protein
MVRRTGLVPFQQGDLDGLCGIYALINAIRLATADDTRDFPDAAWQEVFFTLLLEADEAVSTVEAVGLGIDPQPLFRVAQAAVRHMTDEHGLRLTVTHALRRGEARTLDVILHRLTELSQQPRSAVLICLTGFLDHWTVLRRVTGQSLTFFDSSGCARVSLTNCHSKRLRGARRAYIIEPNGVFLVRAKPPSVQRSP